MPYISNRFAALALPCLLLASATPALADPTTFAQFIQQNGSLQDWAISTSGGTTTVSASANVYFSFSGVTGLPFAGTESAVFTLSATSTQLGHCGVSCGAGDSYVQPGYAGTFSFIDSGAASGANLLSGTFAVTGSPSTTGAQFSSHVGSSGGSFDASATIGNLSQLVFTSQYLSFAASTDEDASWSLSSLIPNFATGTVAGGQAYPASETFNASGSGTFSSNPAPQVLIPEPPAVAVFLGGLAMFGLVLRGRRVRAGAAMHA
jgi:hypothetical protein